jgi:hypothetical protein
MAAKDGRGPRLLTSRAGLACAAWMMMMATACRGPAAGAPILAIEQEVAPRPARVGPATMTIGLKDMHGHAASGARITLEADMSHPGMRPEFGTAKEIEPGRYQGQVSLTMPGDWVILMHIKLRDGREVDRQMEVPGVRAN